MALSFEEFLGALEGAKPMPASEFISYTGRLADEQVEQLAHVVSSNQVSGGFKLHGCMLGDKGAVALAKALQDNTRLRTIELSGNAIGTEGAQALSAMLHNNFTITTLDISDNPCDNTYFDWSLDFEAYIHRNRNGLSNADMFLSPAPSSLAQSSASRRCLSPSPVASLASWAQSSTPTSPKSPTPSPSVAAETTPGPSQASTPSSTLAFFPSPGRSESPLPNRAALQPIENFKNALIPHQHAKADRPASEADSSAVQLHRRLQDVEAMHQSTSSEVHTMKQEASSMEEWKIDMDYASHQAAAVLERLQEQFEEIRSSQRAQKRWQGQIEDASKGFQESANTLSGAWRLMREKVDQLQQDAALGSVQQEQQRQQSEMQALLDDIAQIKEDQEMLAEETGVSQKISGVAMWNRIVGLENECDHFAEVTGRLERYVEEMLRKMLGTLDQGQCRLKVQVEGIAARLSSTEATQAHLADHFRQILEQAQPSSMWQQSQDQMLHEMMGRVQRTEAALGLATPSTALPSYEAAASASTLLDSDPPADSNDYDNTSDIPCEEDQQSSTSCTDKNEPSSAFGAHSNEPSQASAAKCNLLDDVSPASAVHESEVCTTALQPAASTSDQAVQQNSAAVRSITQPESLAAEQGEDSGTRSELQEVPLIQSSVPSSIADKKPKRRFGGFFRFRPANNRFL